MSSDGMPFAECPVPNTSAEEVLLAHGSGGKLTAQLIERLFLPAFRNPLLEALDDQAVVAVNGSRLAFTTDSYVVTPIFFPGGDIGELAVNGTINDLAVGGAEPLCLSLACILEEGLPLGDLQRIVESAQRAAARAGVHIVTGDTKVVGRGSGDKIFINTSGIGVVRPGVDLSSRHVRPGDAILLSGPIGEHGVAILSKSEPADVQTSLCDEVEDTQARVLAATIEGVRIYSVYAPNGQAVGSPAFQYKLQWYRRLRDCLARDRHERVAVAGDLNVAPEDRDTHDPDLWRGAIMCSEPEREAFQALIGAGFADTLRLHHQEAGLFSWWDYRLLAFPKNRGLRIDAILASRALAEKCTDGGIDREMRKGKEPSDHAPVWADFDL